VLQFPGTSKVSISLLPWLHPSSSATVPSAFWHYPQIFSMAILTYIKLVNSAACPKCEYNNITGKTKCEEPKPGGAKGELCGESLPITI